MDAFQLIDHNCWRLVFRKLNGNDLLNCRRVCKPFHHLLDEKEFQQKWKLELILPLIFPHLKTKSNMGHVSWKNLCILRLACKSWRDSIDKYATDYQPPSFFSYNYFSPTKHFPLATRLKTSEKIEDFLQTFGEWNDPFPSKTVHISRYYEYLEGEEDAVRGLQQTQAYIQNVTDFAQRFGRNILKLHLDINLQYFNTDYLFICKLIKGATEQLPNLKTFRVSCHLYNIPGQKLRQDPPQLATWIEQNQLPPLSQLKALEIQGLNEAAEKYLVEKYASQLTHFQRTYPLNIHHQLQFELFQNLSKLSLQLRDHDDPDPLQPLLLLQSPLKTLKLILLRRDDYELDLDFDFLLNFNVTKALHNLQHLPIEYLDIRLNPFVNVTEGDLQLEEYMNGSIQTLKLHFDYYEDNEDGQISFSFLRALRKLETIKFKFSSAENRIGAITHPEGLPEEVDLHHYLDGGEGTMLYQSNIWEKVPSLKTLILKVKRPQFTVTGEEGNVTYYRQDPDFKSKSTFTRDKYDIMN